MAGAAISWSSKKQTPVALFSTEAEYMATIATAKETTWLQILFSEIEPSLTHMPIKLLIDNQLAMSLAKNATFLEWMKHIMICHHYIRKKVDERVMILEYLPTAKQVTDVFTKPLS